MEDFKTMITSSTNWIIFLMVTFLCWLCYFSILHYPDTLFEKVFVVFTNILTGFAGYKYGKSMPQGPKDNISNPPSQDSIVLEK